MTDITLGRTALAALFNGLNIDQISVESDGTVKIDNPEIAAGIEQVKESLGRPGEGPNIGCKNDQCMGGNNPRCENTNCGDES